MVGNSSESYLSKLGKDCRESGLGISEFLDGSLLVLFADGKVEVGDFLDKISLEGFSLLAGGLGELGAERVNIKTEGADLAAEFLAGFVPVGLANESC